MQNFPQSQIIYLLKQQFCDSTSGISVHIADALFEGRHPLQGNLFLRTAVGL